MSDTKLLKRARRAEALARIWKRKAYSEAADLFRVPPFDPSEEEIEMEIKNHES